MTSLKASLTVEQREAATLRAAEAERAAAVPPPTDIDLEAEAERKRRLIALAAAHERAALLAAAGRGTARARMESEMSLGRAISDLPPDQICQSSRHLSAKRTYLTFRFGPASPNTHWTCLFGILLHI